MKRKRDVLNLILTTINIRQIDINTSNCDTMSRRLAIIFPCFFFATNQVNLLTVS